MANDVASNTIARFQTNPTAAPVARGGTLVIAHSTAIEPALLSVAIHKPDHVVLLSLPPTRGSFNQAAMNGIEELLIKSSISVETIELICPYIVDEYAISTALKTTVGCQTRKSPVRIDITPGPKDLILALYQWAVRNAAPCWLIVNKTEGGKIIVDPVYLVSLGEL